MGITGDAGWLSRQSLVRTWDRPLLLRSGCKVVFFLASVISSGSWIFCIDPKYHTEALVVSFGRKESAFQPPWRLVVLPGQPHAVILSMFTGQARR